MPMSVRSSTITFLAAGVWLCCAGLAWAGAGGQNGTIQGVLNEVCAEVGIKTCPKLPTITQLILEISGL
jgi:hypothetical protein